MSQLSKPKIALEKIVQKAVINKLRSYGCYVARVNNNKITGAGVFVKLKDEEKGVPDAICCIGGNFVAFEFKALKGSQSIFQRAQQKVIEQTAGLYYVIRTEQEFDELWEKLKCIAAPTVQKHRQRVLGL